ncbi:MAG: MraY family glycosyltransferase [Desulfobulbus sp.]|nr:MraY family glycosyltransferase [Desulfobulbus sp.]
MAIFAAWIVPVLLTTDMSREAWGMMAGAFIMFTTGLIDDIYDISAVRKLACQIFASLVTMFFGGFYIKVLCNFPGITTITLPSWLVIPATIFFVVGIVNAFNMIDGLDGLAGGVGIITLSTFAILAYLSDNYLILPLTIALIGGIIGFLKYNFYPARIFMGDSGSLTIGFITAFLAISLTQTPLTNVRPVVPLLILGIPITDLLFVSAKRTLTGKNPFAADRNHLHHKLLDIGFEHSFTVLIIYSISLLLSISSLLYYRFNEPILMIFNIFFLFILYRILGFKLVSAKTNSLNIGKP